MAYERIGAALPPMSTGSSGLTTSSVLTPNSSAPASGGSLAPSAPAQAPQAAPGIKAQSPALLSLVAPADLPARIDTARKVLAQLTVQLADAATVNNAFKRKLADATAMRARAAKDLEHSQGERRKVAKDVKATLEGLLAAGLKKGKVWKGGDEHRAIRKMIDGISTSHPVQPRDLRGDLAGKLDAFTRQGKIKKEMFEILSKALKAVKSVTFGDPNSKQQLVAATKIIEDTKRPAARSQEVLSMAQEERDAQQRLLDGLQSKLPPDAPKVQPSGETQALEQQATAATASAVKDTQATDAAVKDADALAAEAGTPSTPEAGGGMSPTMLAAAAVVGGFVLLKLLR